MREATAYHHGDLRNVLVAIARELVRESGVDGWSLREASRRAGVSQTAPYRHFADKMELLDAVGRQAYVELEQRYRLALARNRSPGADAEVAARAYLRFAFDEPRLFRLIFSSPKLHDTPEAVSSYGVFEDAVRKTQAAGGLPQGSSTRFAHVIWAGVHGIADLVLSGSFSRRHGEDVADLLLGALLEGSSR